MIFRDAPGISVSRVGPVSPLRKLWADYTPFIFSDAFHEIIEQLQPLRKTKFGRLHFDGEA
jgi:hypothetical protein